MDRASLIGMILGISAVVLGNVLEGGKIRSLLQPTAAVIVFGGTFGATLLSAPPNVILRALLALREVFSGQKDEREILIKDIVRFATVARRNGLIALESEIERIENQYFKRALRLAVDGMSPKMLRETMEQDNISFEEGRRRIAKVYETAGGFAPTIGILGAVLGLIHVMENLSDPSKLGAGIAVAFVATIYGVGSANLIFLPISKKLINRANEELRTREMILEGVSGIQTGINPHYLEERLRVYI
ncbi:MAG: flagellar motor protein [Thermodesulfovibrionales bacterium]